ncbi:MAG: RAD55 family ATPase [Candidatus Geothermincolia bacterium]
MQSRVLTGAKGLDAMLGGGLLPGTVTVVKGAPGTGKSSIGVEFIYRGAEQFGEAGIIVSFEESSSQYYRDARSIGCDLEPLVEAGKVKIVFTSPDAFLSELKSPGGLYDRMAAESGIKRVVVDSMSRLESVAADRMALRETVYSFLNGLLRYEVTVLVTEEDLSITGALNVAEAGLPYIADTIIQLRYVELHSQMRRAILVLKHRASDHDHHIRQFEITGDGIVVKGSFEDAENILSGEARVVRRVRRAREFFAGPQG